MQHTPCDHVTRRVGEALLREADPVDEGVGVAGEALGALVDEQVAVVARRLGGGRGGAMNTSS